MFQLRNSWLCGLAFVTSASLPLVTSAQDVNDCLDPDNYPPGEGALEMASACAAQLPALLVDTTFEGPGDGFVALPSFPNSFIDPNGTVVLSPDKDGYVEVQTQAFYRDANGNYSQRPDVTLMNAALFGSSISPDGQGGSLRSKEDTDYFVWDAGNEIYRTCWKTPEFGVAGYTMAVTDDPASLDNPYHIADDTQANRTSNYSILQSALSANDLARSDRMDQSTTSLVTVGPRNLLRTATCPINGPKIVSITADRTIGEAPLDVTFTAVLENRQNTASNNRYQVLYVLTTGDGSDPVTQIIAPPATSAPEYQIQFTHTYSAPGSYTFKLATADPNRDDAITFQEDEIDGTVINVKSPSAKPIAFISGPDQVAVDEIATFTPNVFDEDTSSEDLTCDFDFGDGNAVEAADCSNAQDHTYDTAGSYTVTLTANDGSSISEDTHTITVYEGPAAAVCELDIVLVATNVSDSTSEVPVESGSEVAVPATLRLDAMIDGSQGPADVYNYTFDYGDNGITDPGTIQESSTTSPSDAYDNVGNIVASVIVTNNAGECGSATLPFTMTNSITVEDIAGPRNLEAKLTASTQKGKAPLAVTFNATSTIAARDASGEIVAITSREISFEADGTSVPIPKETDANGNDIYAIDHAYAEKGSYTATLTVTDEAGSQDTASVTIEVLDGRVNTALLNVTPSTGKVGDVFTFDGSDTIVVDGFEVVAWELNTAEKDVNGDDIVLTLGESDDGLNPVWSHAYGTAAEYSPSLTVTYDSNDASSTNAKALTQSRAFVKVNVIPEGLNDPATPVDKPTGDATKTPVDNATDRPRQGSGALGWGLLIFAGLMLGRRRLN